MKHTDHSRVRMNNPSLTCACLKKENSTFSQRTNVGELHHPSGFPYKFGPGNGAASQGDLSRLLLWGWGVNVRIPATRTNPHGWPSHNWNSSVIWTAFTLIGALANDQDQKPEPIHHRGLSWTKCPARMGKPLFTRLNILIEPLPVKHYHQNLFWNIQGMCSEPRTDFQFQAYVQVRTAGVPVGRRL